MRTLIYVPIIHTSADLGSLAADVARRGIAGLGEEAWAEHGKTVDGFWNAVSRYFDSIEVSGMKIYQDGMVAEGEVGGKIVAEGVKMGSKNYRLVERLIKRGAVMVKTEDFMLVKEERDRILELTRAGNVAAKLRGFLRYRLSKRRLLDRRDRFIAGRIDETLGKDETGIIFLGAYHDIIRRLPADIKIEEIRNVDKVREYQRLLPFCKKRAESFAEIGRYLVSEIDRRSR